MDPGINSIPVVEAKQRLFHGIDQLLADAV
jgi:hypothetical protein